MVCELVAASCIENFGDNSIYTDCVGDSAYELYGESLACLGPGEEMEVTQVDIDGVLLLDHSTSDLDLRCLVAAELENSCRPVNDIDLFNLFVELRDACKRNYDDKVGVCLFA